MINLSLALLLFNNHKVKSSLKHFLNSSSNEGFKKIEDEEENQKKSYHSPPKQVIDTAAWVIIIILGIIALGIIINWIVEYLKQRELDRQRKLGYYA